MGVEGLKYIELGVMGNSVIPVSQIFTLPKEGFARFGDDAVNV